MRLICGDSAASVDEDQCCHGQQAVFEGTESGVGIFASEQYAQAQLSQWKTIKINKCENVNGTRVGRREFVAPWKHAIRIRRTEPIGASLKLYRIGQQGGKAVHERKVTVVESLNAPYGQFITAGTHVLGADEPVELGGLNTGPDPFELLLSALGACTAMTIRMYAQRRKMPLEKVEVRLRHAQRATSEGGMSDRFERNITLSGNLSDDERQRLLQIADKCPVSQTLQRSSSVTSILGAR